MGRGVGGLGCGVGVWGARWRCGVRDGGFGRGVGAWASGRNDDHIIFFLNISYFKPCKVKLQTFVFTLFLSLLRAIFIDFGGSLCRVYLFLPALSIPTPAAVVNQTTHVVQRAVLHENTLPDSLSTSTTSRNGVVKMLFLFQKKKSGLTMKD